MASGINSTFRQVGIATGIAAWGAIFQHVVRRSSSTAAGPACRAAAAAATSPTSSRSAAPPQLGNATRAQLAEQAFVDGLNHILLLAGLLAFVGAVLAAVLMRPADFFAQPAPAAPPQPVVA